MITAPQFIGLLILVIGLGGIILYSISLMRVKHRTYTKEERIAFVKRKYARIFASIESDKGYEWYRAVKTAEEEEIRKIINE